MQLTRNFHLKEFVRSSTSEKFGIKNEPGEEEKMKLERLCKKILQPVREKFGKPILITSGYRCELLNQKVGGVQNSQHKYGEAADIICNDNRKLWNLIVSMINNKEIIVGQLINERNFSWIHISLPTNNKINQII